MLSYGELYKDINRCTGSIVSQEKIRMSQSILRQNEEKLFESGLYMLLNFNGLKES